MKKFIIGLLLISLGTLAYGVDTKVSDLGNHSITAGDDLFYVVAGGSADKKISWQTLGKQSLDIISADVNLISGTVVSLSSDVGLISDTVVNISGDMIAIKELGVIISDDSTEYLIVDGTRVMTGTLDMNANVIDNVSQINITGVLAAPIITILSDDVNTMSQGIITLSGDVIAISDTVVIISNDLLAYTGPLATVSTDVNAISDTVVNISGDLIVMKEIDVIISADAVDWESTVEKATIISSDIGGSDMIRILSSDANAYTGPFIIVSDDVGTISQGVITLSGDVNAISQGIIVISDDINTYGGPFVTISTDVNAISDTVVNISGDAIIWAGVVSRDGVVSADSVSTDAINFRGNWFDETGPTDNYIFKFDKASNTFKLEADAGGSASSVGITGSVQLSDGSNNFVTGAISYDTVTHSLQVDGNISCDTISADTITCDTISCDILSSTVISTDVFVLYNVRFPEKDAPADNEIIKFDDSVGRFVYEADAGGSAASVGVNYSMQLADGATNFITGTVSYDTVAKSLTLDGNISCDTISADGSVAVGSGTNGSVSFGVNTLTDDIVGGLLKGVVNLKVQSAKLKDTTGSGPRIDGGTDRWALTSGGLETGGSAQWQFRMPYDYSEFSDTLTAKIGYTMSSDAANIVQFHVYVMALTDGDSWDVDTDSFGLPNIALATVPGTAGYLDEISVTLISSDSVAPGDLCVIALSRDASDSTVDWSEVRYLQLEYLR